jgi:hypothetical protein
MPVLKTACSLGEREQENLNAFVSIAYLSDPDKVKQFATAESSGATYVPHYTLF